MAGRMDSFRFFFVAYLEYIYKYWVSICQDCGFGEPDFVFYRNYVQSQDNFQDVHVLDRCQYSSPFNCRKTKKKKKNKKNSVTYIQKHAQLINNVRVTQLLIKIKDVCVLRTQKTNIPEIYPIHFFHNITITVP